MDMQHNLPPSLLVLSLPRSLSSAVYQCACRVLGLAGVGWASDGEFLNADRLGWVSLPSLPGQHYLLPEDGAAFAHALAYARDVLAPQGRVYKDVTQPFVIEKLLADHPNPPRVLRIVRPVADVAFAMLRREWTWPARRYPGMEPQEAIVHGLLDARDALERIGGRVASFDDIVLEEGNLALSLASLYPGLALAPVELHDETFLRARDLVQARRYSDEYRRLEEVVFRAEERRCRPSADAAPPPAPSPRTRPVLLAIGDGFAPTGFGRVVESLLRHLVDDFEIHQLGIAYQGKGHPYPWTLHPCLEQRGTTEIGRLCAQLRPDVVLMINDMWIIAEYVRIIGQVPGSPRLVAYCPVDSEPVNPQFVAGLRGAHRLVTYTQFGRQEIEKTMGLLQIEPTWPSVEVIPHGVDTDCFRPLAPVGPGLVASRRQSRAELFGKDAALQDAFIVLNGNRNQPRKCIDLTVEGFARFAEGKDDARLYLHMGTEDQGWDVRRLAERFGILAKLLISVDSPLPPALSTQDLNRVYNACDVGINTSYAEGWGLVSFEHAATGAAQIVPRHTGPAEIWHGHAEFLEVCATVCAPRSLSNMHFTSSGQVADALNRLYADPDLLETRARQALSLATSRRLRWAHIAEQWRELLLAEAQIAAHTSLMTQGATHE